MEIAILAVLVGLGIGVVVGALGAGGGILAVPVLVYLLHQPPHVATASSLVIVAITALASIVHHARVRNVAWRDGLIFGGIAVLGAVLGARLSALVHPDLLMILFGSMLVVVAFVMGRRAVLARRAEDHDRPPGGGKTGLSAPASGQDLPMRRVPLPLLILIATFTGLLTGFFGVGGGFIVVPMLVIALKLPMRRAAGTSLLVMIIASVAGLMGRIGTGIEIDWAVTLLFAAGSSIGGMLGGPLSARARPSTLTFAFTALLGVVALATFGSQVLG